MPRIGYCKFKLVLVSYEREPIRMYKDLASIEHFVVDVARVKDGSLLKELPSELIEKYRACVDLLCDAKVYVSFKAKEYGSYMGNAPYT